MRAIQIAIFGICLVLFLVFGLFQAGATDPREKAAKFLKNIANGDRVAASELFGDNTCVCPPKGGYISYLQYQSALEPNLTFLLGQPFTVSALQLVKMINQERAVFWEQPQTAVVSAQLDFPISGRQPLLLPAPLAFGKSMTERQFKDYFLADPKEAIWRGFSLRLRPTLKPGLIPAHKADPKERELALANIWPTDPAPVIRADGKPLPLTEVQSQLPKLKSLLIEIEVVRRGEWKDWLIKSVKFREVSYTWQGTTYTLSRRSVS